jgi:hypothetical protein
MNGNFENRRVESTSIKRAANDAENKYVVQTFEVDRFDEAFDARPRKVGDPSAHPRTRVADFYGQNW